MTSKRNPLGLNPLQLKTLTLLQQMARLPDFVRSAGEDGCVAIAGLPAPHGDHFHLGEAVVASRDATGLRNPAVWKALVRKGLIRATPGGPALTPLGLDYDTGLRDAILHAGAH